MNIRKKRARSRFKTWVGQYGKKMFTKFPNESGVKRSKNAIDLYFRYLFLHLNAMKREKSSAITHKCYDVIFNWWNISENNIKSIY